MFFRIVDSFQLLIFVTNIIILVVERILYLSLLIVVMSSNILRQKSSLVSQHTLILDLVTVVKMSFANVSQTGNAKVLCDRGRELSVWITWQCLIGFFVVLFCSFVVLFGWTVLLVLLIGTALEFLKAWTIWCHFWQHSGSSIFWVFKWFFNVLTVRWWALCNNKKRSRHWQVFLENRYCWNFTVT